MNINIKKTIQVLFIFGAGVFLYTCEHPETDIPTENTTISSEIVAGWAAYTDSEYETAIEHFTVSALRNSAEPEAYNGLAWSQLKLQEFEDASSQFNFVNNLATEQDNDVLLAESYAGVAMLWDSKRYIDELDGVVSTILHQHLDAAILSGEMALTIDADYSSLHDPSYDANAIRLALGRNYFYQHWYKASLDKLSDAGIFSFADIVAESSLDTTMTRASIVPVLQEETLEMTMASIMINWADTAVAYVDGKNLTGIVSFTNLTDNNGGSSLAETKLQDGTTFFLENADDFEYPSITEKVTSTAIRYPIDGPASEVYMLALDKGGVFEISGINKKEANYLDVYLPDGTTRKDTVYEFLPYAGTYEIFRFSNGYSTAATDSAFAADFKYNYVYLEDERAAGNEFEITYSYAWYGVDLIQTENYDAYLGLLSRQFE